MPKGPSAHVIDCYSVIGDDGPPHGGLDWDGLVAHS
jgi:hypothetical protein